MLRLNSVRLLITLAIVALIACKSEKSQDRHDLVGNEDQLNNDNESFGLPSRKPEIGSLSGDTLNIGGKFVLFFGPNETPDSLINYDPEVLQSFKASCIKLIDSLSANADIKAVYSTAAIFRIATNNGGTMIITKSALNENAGLLMTDGSQPPTIKKGMLPAEEYLLQIKRYFFLE